MIGRVIAFDADAGLGEVEAADGTRLAFHCIAIADGSRRVDVGTAVQFDVTPRLGRWEAWAIRPS
jgi:cold shock CspA family protein